MKSLLTFNIGIQPMLRTEQEVLQFWDENNIFAKSIEQRQGQEAFVFLDGPPFPSGDPHLGHMSTAYPKDIFPRFWTQKGKYCVRRWGWDCHGLPIENFVQKKIGISDKRKIVSEIGIGDFNQLCRDSIFTLDSEWRSAVWRSGRWVDMDDQYRTMDNDYIESVWWGLGQLWQKGLMKKDYRVSLYSPSMGVHLSHFEIADDIEYVKETIETPIVRFKVEDEPAKKLRFQLLEAISFNLSEQLRYKSDIEKRIEGLEKLDDKSRKLSLKELLKSNRPEFNGLEWSEFKTDLEAYQELDHLRDQLEVVLENIQTLEGFKAYLEKDYNLSLLTWTTTPWTLPANVALAVGADINYGLYFLTKTQELVVVAEKRAIPTLSLLFKEEVVNSPELQSRLDEAQDSSEYFDILGIDIVKVASLTGNDLEGLSYEPIFPLAQEVESYEQKNNMYRVYAAEFASEDDGTGIVHIAPAYGPDDFEMGKQRNLPVITCLNEFGEVREDLHESLKSIYGKKFTAADDIVNKLLEKQGSLFGLFKFPHKYPVYSRDKKKVYYCADENWYIKETQFVEKSKELNELVNWYPEHLKHGRVENGFDSAPDWCISRKRFWGNPMPIWQTEDKSKMILVDSVEKLAQHAVNPIYTLLNTRDLRPEYYKDGRVVIVCDSQVKLPLGISATQFRSKAITDARKLKRLDVKAFAPFAQRILDEILELFEKYSKVQLLLDDHEQQLWTTWLYTLHPKSKKKSQIFYFYKQVEYDFDGYKPKGIIKMLDLHRPFIDDIILKDEVENYYHRIEDVLDGWVESGSMHWASYHYPFENKEFVEKNLPADYIVEYEGQIRGWFHALHVLSTAIFDQPSFKNVHTHGTVLGYDNKKMSKSRGNFQSLDEYYTKYGSDAIRSYVTSSPLFVGESLTINDKDMNAALRDTTLTLGNAIQFIEFVMAQYPIGRLQDKYVHPLNKWWIAYTTQYAQELVNHLENYRLIDASRMVVPYIRNFSTWYIRRAKDILGTHGKEVTSCLIETMKLFCIVTASLQPFNTERMWSVIKDREDKESVHLTDIPELKEIDEKEEKMLKRMNRIRALIGEIHSIRKEKNIRVRQPLYADFSEITLSEHWTDLIRLECNLLPRSLSNMEGELQEYTAEFGTLKLDLVVDTDLAVLGFARDFERSVQGYRKQRGFRPGQIVPMKWEIVGTEDYMLVEKVIKSVDWDKLAVEVTWVKGLDEKIDTNFTIKDLCTILVD
jgi:isoleucyl-tRNA synthetase